MSAKCSSTIATSWPESKGVVNKCTTTFGSNGYLQLDSEWNALANRLFIFKDLLKMGSNRSPTG